MAWCYYKQETNLCMIPAVILWLWWYKPIFVEVTTSSFSSKILLENNLQCIQTGLTTLDEYFCLQLLKSKVSWMAWYCFQDAFTTAASPCFCPTAVFCLCPKSIPILTLPPSPAAPISSLLSSLMSRDPPISHLHTPYLSLHCSPLCSLTALSRNFSFYLNVGNVVTVPEGYKEPICKSHHQLHVATANHHNHRVQKSLLAGAVIYSKAKKEMLL